MIVFTDEGTRRERNRFFPRGLSPWVTYSCASSSSTDKPRERKPEHELKTCHQGLPGHSPKDPLEPLPNGQKGTMGTWGHSIASDLQGTGSGVWAG